MSKPPKTVIQKRIMRLIAVYLVLAPIPNIMRQAKFTAEKPDHTVFTFQLL